MDKELLVEKLKIAFERARTERGLEIEAFSLAPGWNGLVPGTWVLVVLAPSLIYETEYERIKRINSFVFSYFSKPERSAISTVKIFVDPIAFKEKSKFNFDADEEDEYNRIIRRNESEIFEMH